MAELRWDGRVAVVTGAGRNLGRSYARFLASRGARVVVNDLGVAISDTDGSGAPPPANPAHDVVDEIRSSGGEAVASTHDVTTVDGGEAIIGTALDAFGRVDVLINNAGVVRQAAFEDYVPELTDPVFDSQLGGHFNVTRPAWRAMKEAGYGRIVNLSSGAGLWGVKGMAAYGAAKMGIVGLTRVLAIEGAPHGINANVVAPLAKTRPGGFGPIPASPALHEWLSPEQITPVVAWLVHEGCSATGECFSVGGGYVGRVVVAVNDGWRGDRPLTPEALRDHFDVVMADAPLTGLPPGWGDTDRMLRGYTP
jgi:NAD(P)-dependent dehydrogenase (short-subunit alcohol dehydrogenase family)